MDRRQLLKSISIFTGAAILSPQYLLANSNSKKLHFVGVGDGGCKMIEYLLSKGEQIGYTAINSNYKGYFFATNKQVVFELPIDAYNGRNMNLTTLQSQKGLPKNIANVFTDKSRHYVVFIGLGGYTGSYLSKEVISHFEAKNLRHNCIISLPFTHEGLIKRKNAEMIKSSLSNCKNIAFVDFNLIRENQGNFKMVDAFEIANKYQFDYYKLMNA